MTLFLDSALLDEVVQARSLGFVGGVTTNPALIAKAGRPGLDILRDILEAIDGPVFYQVTNHSVEGREQQAREASALAPRRVNVKIPATTENLVLAAGLTRDGVLCAATAVSHPAQAYVAVEAGCAYAIPYVSRLTRQLGDGVAVLRQCVELAAGTSTRILAASLKTPQEVVEAVLAGAQDITVPLDVLLALGEHELSYQAIEDFDQAMREAEGS
jgi:transaldolase